MKNYLLVLICTLLLGACGSVTERTYVYGSDRGGVELAKIFNALPDATTAATTIMGKPDSATIESSVSRHENQTTIRTPYGPYIERNTGFSSYRTNKFRWGPPPPSCFNRYISGECF